MKKFIAGFIVGIIVALGVTAFADEVTNLIAQKATFDVYVAGEKLESDKPIAVIDGSTYLPLKATGEALGVDVNWNVDKKQVEINKKEEVISMPEDSSTSIATSEVVETSTLSPTPTSTISNLNTLIPQNIKLKEVLGIKNLIFNLDESYKMDMAFKPLIDSDNQVYIAISSFPISLYNRDSKMIKLANGETIHVDKVSIKNQQTQGTAMINLSAIGLKATINGDTCTIEKQ